MGRPLTPRERSVLIAMLTLGEAAEPIPEERRREWVSRVPAIQAGPRCGCGTCPSIALLPEPQRPSDPILLHGSTDGAGLLVSIDDDQPSYLELYPTGGQAFSEFPPPEALSFC
ncbi:MAG: hypothetical protein Q4B08_02680 [Propionibacteriaceae bacterium]|nr:hypothetical protein [Propionibacteriaceae bacterium]